MNKGFTLKPDFIVIGAGSSGCVVAERLSENGKYSVVLLEAGGTDNRFFVKMPLGYGKTFFDPTVNWAFQTESDTGLGGRKDFWPRGKVVGGSSSINAMVWIRGSRLNYDSWRDAGNIGWGWDDMLPIFKAIENVPFGDPKYRGQSGPVHIRNIEKQVHPLTHSFIAACEELGLHYNSDFNADSQEGVGIYQLNSKDGRRFSIADSFLKPALNRSNLRLIKNAMVTKIEFDGKRAVHVEFDKNGSKQIMSANKEIILCAGAIMSPKLLELSGIGQVKKLNQFGIEVVNENNQVGENLNDHQGINYTYKSNQKTLNDQLRPWWGKLVAGTQYLLFKKGPLSLSINHGGGFFKTDEKRAEPNMQLYFQAFSTVVPGVDEKPILTPDPFSGFSIGLSNCNPRSTGSVHIASADPNKQPTIKTSCFSDERDVKEMLMAVKYLRKIANAPSMKKVIVEEVLPGIEVLSDEALIEDFRQRSGTVYHPVSTCKMDIDEKKSVVDPRLKVHGIEGLRVIDASIFPEIITGNTNAACVAVGWKGAQMILEDHS